jgi:hypothetical protein
MKKSFVLVLGLAMVALAACDNLQTIDKQVSIKLDPALDQPTQDLIRADVHALENYQFKADPNGYYAKAFGGTTAQDALRFMGERINYMVPQQDDLLKRLRLGPFPIPGANDSSDDGSSVNDPRAVVMALNIGTALWFVQLANKSPFTLNFKIGDTSVPLTSPRVGLVELGPGYTMTQTPGGTQITAVIRSETLVHEARHSDCTGGLAQSDLDLINAGQMPQNHECGHLHINCPEGHPLAGLPACDDLPWGAYTIGALYAKELALSCQNCTAVERAQAVADAADSFSRVTVLADMLNGKYGDPDMSSSDQVRANDPNVQQFLNAIRSERNKNENSSALIQIQ